MRAVVQRVSEASVTSSTEAGAVTTEVGRIGAGLVVLVGVTHDDTAATATRLAHKVHDLRIFPDEHGQINRSCAQVGGQILVVSQFTLYADTRKGRRPSFVDAARPEVAEPLVDVVATRLRERGATVATGVFRTHMQVSLTNDGPVTVIVEI